MQNVIVICMCVILEKKYGVRKKSYVFLKIQCKSQHEYLPNHINDKFYGNLLRHKITSFVILKTINEFSSNQNKKNNQLFQRFPKFRFIFLHLFFEFLYLFYF